MRKILEVDGIKVITQTQAYGRHPNPNITDPVQLTNVIHVLLADETERFLCGICYTQFTKPTSVVAHLSSHTAQNSTTHHRTLDTLIKTVIRVVLRNMDKPSCYQSAADELNAEGIKTIHNKAWTAGRVGDVWRKNRTAYASYIRRMQLHSAQTTASTLTPKTNRTDNQNTTSDALDADKTYSIAQVRDVLTVLRTKLDQMNVALTDVSTRTRDVTNTFMRMLDLLNRLTNDVAQTAEVNTDIIEKAQKYDQMCDLIK